ncbi:MAG: hypothetical protein IKJ92_08465 [Bacteroidaceae bacterium]|nr:hypothetical protein [Bacteroidaceae bacterium]
MDKFRLFRLLLPAIAILAFASCDNEEDELANLTLSQSFIEIPYTGGSTTIMLDCNKDWYSSISSTTINGKTSYLNPFSVTPSYGSSGQTCISISGEQNKFIDNITQVLRFSCGEVYRDLVITQKGNPNGMDENGNYPNGGDNPIDNGTISAPQNLRAYAGGYQIRLVWDGVNKATYYGIYYSSSYSGSYDRLGYAYASDGTSILLDADPGTYYFKVTAATDSQESSFSNVASATVTGNDDGGNDDGGNDDNSGQKPSAPTSVYAENYGSATVPDVRISWDAVSGATGYHVYRSTSANGSYSKLGSTSYTFYSDYSCKVGNVYYYKVKAYNNAGESAFSDYAEFNFKDTRKPGPAKYGNCTVSGTTMTIRWSVPTDPSYGKPTKALLRVKDPYSDEYATVEEMPGTATSVSFQYLPWVNSDGFIYVGIILENDYGTGGGTPKIYDNNAKEWVY